MKRDSLIQHGIKYYEYYKGNDFEHRLTKQFDIDNLPIEHVALGYILQSLSIKDGQRLCGLIPGKQDCFPALSWSSLVGTFRLHEFGKEIPIPFAKTVPMNNANYPYTRTIIAREADNYEALKIPGIFDVSGKNVVITSNIQEKQTYMRKFGPWSTKFAYICSYDDHTPKYLYTEIVDSRQEPFIMKAHFKGNSSDYKSQYVQVIISSFEYNFLGEFDHTGMVVNVVPYRR